MSVFNIERGCMACGKTHIGAGVIVGVIALLVTAIFFGAILNPFLVGAAVLFGAAWPDMDIKSHSQKLCGLVLVGLFAWFMWMCQYPIDYAKMVIIVALGIVPLFLPHRGPTHWIPVQIIVAGVIGLVLGAWSVPVGFLIGCLVHDLLDIS
jgi:hypothetical protein